MGTETARVVGRSVRLTDTELRAWQALLHAHQDVNRTLDAELRAEHGISLSSYDVLLRLIRAPDRRLRMSELAGRVMMPASTVTRVVDRLVKDGLVTRAGIDADGRVLVAEITSRGRATVRRAARTHLRGIREHFTDRLDEAELRDLGAILEKITGPHAPH